MHIKHVHLIYGDIFNGFINFMLVKLSKIIIVLILLPLSVNSEGFSVHFKDADIKEFINTVSKNINKTIIIDP